MSGLDRLRNLFHSSETPAPSCESALETRPSSASLFDPASLLSEMNRVWENLSLNASRAHHLLRDQVYNGGEVLSERLESWGEPGTALRAGALLIFLSRNPALTVDQFHWIGSLPEPFRNQFWQRALDILERRGVPFHREEMGSYEQFIELLHRYGITYDRRIHSLETALHLLHQRRHPAEAGRDRSLAVVVANIDDYNGAFESRFIIDDLVRSGRYDVVYFEESGDHEAIGALESLYQQTGGRGIDALVLAGHGSRTSLQLGKTDRPPTGDSDSPWVDVGDFERGEWSSLATYLAPHAHVILWACSNGAPEEDSASRFQNSRVPNLADELAFHLPGRTIHATETPNNIAGIAFASDGSPVITWQDDTPHVVRSSCGEEAKAVADSRDGGMVPRSLLDFLEEAEGWMNS